MSQVKFYTKPELDANILLFFAKQNEENRGGFNVFANLIRTYPEFGKAAEFYGEEREQFVRELTEKEYNAKLPEIQKNHHLQTQ